MVAVLVLASALVGCVENTIVPEETEAGSSSTTAGVASTTAEVASATTEPSTSSGMIEGSSSGFATTAVDEGTTACSADEGAVFIYGPPPECQCPDPPPHCEQPPECDLFAQDCPEGEKCTAWSTTGGAWDAVRCVPVVPDPDQVGEPCTAEESASSGLDSCDLGSMCWNVDEVTLTGTCVAICTGSADDPSCEEPGTSCAITNGGAIVLCLPTCDPIVQSCPEGEGCYPVEDAWFCSSDGSGELGGYGDPCAFINVCDPGLVCLDASMVPPGQACEGGAGCCTEVCDLADPAGDLQCTGAPEGQICQPWYEAGMAPAGYEDVGVCTLP